VTASPQLDLFGTTGPIAETQQPNEARRGKHYRPPRGYAKPPGSGPVGETCGSCQHKCRVGTRSGKTFLKCALLQAYRSSGTGTDIRAGAAACSMWQRAEQK
jgi:hypothetical protein